MPPPSPRRHGLTTGIAAILLSAASTMLPRVREQVWPQTSEKVD